MRSILSHFKCVIVLFFLESASVAFGQLQLPFLIPKEYYNCVSPRGYFHLWRQLDIVRIEGVELPLMFDFASERLDVSPNLGRGWKCNLIESQAKELKNKAIVVNFPTGIRIGLRGRGGEYEQEGMAFSMDGRSFKWRGHGHVQDTFRLDGLGKWALFYEKGLLTKMQTDTGHLITWDMKEGRLVGIKDESDTYRLKVEYDKSGLAKSLIVGDHIIELQFQSGWLSGVLCPRLNDAYTYGESGEFHYLLLKSIEAGVTSVTAYKWNEANQLVSDGTYEYLMGSTSSRSPLPQITRRSLRGNDESVGYNPKTGVTEIKSPDGVTTKHYTVLSGPNFGVERKVEQLETNRQVKVLYNAEFDEKGKVARITGEKPFFAQQTNTDLSFLKNYKIDSAGHVISRKDDRGNIWLYSYDSTGSRNKISLNGKVVWTNASTRLPED